MKQICHVYFHKMLFVSYCVLELTRLFSIILMLICNFFHVDKTNVRRINWWITIIVRYVENSTFDLKNFAIKLAQFMFVKSVLSGTLRYTSRIIWSHQASLNDKSAGKSNRNKPSRNKIESSQANRSYRARYVIAIPSSHLLISNYFSASGICVSCQRKWSRTNEGQNSRMPSGHPVSLYLLHVPLGGALTLPVTTGLAGGAEQ